MYILWFNEILCLQKEWISSGAQGRATDRVRKSRCIEKRTIWCWFFMGFVDNKKNTKIASLILSYWVLFLCKVKVEIKKGIVTDSKYASWVYLYSGEFGCKIKLCNRQRLGQNVAQKAVLLWSDVSRIVHSCASLSLQAAILLTSWWQTSQYPWLSVRDSHTHLAEASTLSVSFFLCFLTAKETNFKNTVRSGSAPA